MLWEVISLILIEVGRLAHCGCHFLGRGPCIMRMGIVQQHAFTYPFCFPVVDMLPVASSSCLIYLATIDYVSLHVSHFSLKLPL